MKTAREIARKLACELDFMGEENFKTRRIEQALIEYRDQKLEEAVKECFLAMIKEQDSSYLQSGVTITKTYRSMAAYYKAYDLALELGWIKKEEALK